MYNNHIWIDGEVITATKLNNMENGILTNAMDMNLASEFSTDLAYTTGQYVVNYGVLYKFIADKAAGEWDASKVTEITVGAELKDIADEKLTEAKLDPTFAASLAKVDGSYEGMTVGNAEQLVSTVGVEDSAPYTFRTTGGSADVGDRMNLKKVVGGTVAWNQLVPNANATFTSDNTDTRALNFYFRKGVSPYTSLYNKSNVQTGILSSIVSASFDGYIQMVHAGADRNMYYVPRTTISVQNGHKYLFSLNFTGTDVSIVGGVTAKDIQIFDLTAMFGSTIADYIYSLEQSNAGAGVAYFRKLFPKPYYAYNSGELLSVQTSAHKTIGFNQWDEEWEVGGIDSSSGANVVGTNTIRAKNNIRIIPNTVYHYKCSAAAVARYYDASGNYLASYTAAIIANSNFTTPSDAAFMRFVVFAAYGTTYKHDICINLHWDGERDGEYEPYTEHEYALSDITLRGVPKLDASNNLYFDGDEYTPDGTVTRKYGTRAYTSGDATDGSTMITDGTTTVYKLTTPTTESADAYTELQICNDFGTEEFVDAATRDFDMPCGSLSVYQSNLRAKLEMAPNSPANGNGDYIVRQTDGVNEYVLFSEVKELPDLPTTDGTYVLKCTVADGTATLSWVSE